MMFYSNPAIRIIIQRTNCWVSYSPIPLFYRFRFKLCGVVYSLRWDLRASAF